MSGIIQHEIPQLFQRGFLISGNAKAEQIFVFRKGGSTFISNINRSGAERFFYSEPSENGERTLDDEITEYERRLARLVNELRALEAGAVANAEAAAEVIAHLTTRNAHLRGAFAHGFQTFASTALDAFSDEETVRHMLGISGASISTAFRGKLKEIIERQPALAALGVPPELLERILFAAVREGFSPFFKEQKTFIETVLRQLSADAPAQARKGHKQALSNSMVSKYRVAQLSELEWRVVGMEHDAILPDCVALAVGKAGDAQPLMMAGRDEVEAVLLPLTSRSILAGIKPGASIPDISTFNADAAACSHTYFLRASKSNDDAALIENIGTRSITVVDDAVKKALREKQPVPQADQENFIAKPQDLAGKKFTFAATFIGSFDADTIKNISDTLSAIIGEAAWTMPFDRLDGITIADDYPAALASLDRGMEDAAPLEARQDALGTGIAQAPNVIRDGIVKGHIVLSSIVAHALVGDNVDHRVWASCVLGNQLAHIGITQVFDETLPNVLLSRAADGLEGDLQQCTYPAWNAYFASRATARFDANRLKDVQSTALIALKDFFEEIVRERIAYRHSSNLQILMMACFRKLPFLLEWCANVIGHAHGAEDEPLKDADELKAELENHALLGWFYDFGRDLQTLWNRRGAWKSYDEFLALNRHAERLLWSVSIFPLSTPQGGYRVEVPLYVDAKTLGLEG